MIVWKIILYSLLGTLQFLMSATIFIVSTHKYGLIAGIMITIAFSIFLFVLGLLKLIMLIETSDKNG